MPDANMRDRPMLDEIEITPAMIEAGEAVMYDRIADMDSFEYTVSEVYRAMEMARRLPNAIIKSRTSRRVIRRPGGNG